VDKLKRIGLFFLALAGVTIFPSQSCSTPAFNSRFMMDLFEKLPEEIRVQIKEQRNTSPGTFLIDADMICDNSIIIFRLNQYSELVHLGIHVTSELPEKKQYSTVINYIERLLLTCCLLNNHEAIFLHLQLEKVEIIINGEPLADLLQHDSFCSAITYAKNAPVSIERSPEGFHAIFSPDHFNHVSIKFPADIFTISGMDKYELENMLVRDMISLPKGQTVHVNNSSAPLYRYSNRVSMRQGLVYSGIAGISSNQFFYRNRVSSPVFDKANFYESASNLFLNIIPSGINLQINHKLYGGRTEKYIVNINDFLSSFGDAYTIYFGWQSRDMENLIASVFIFNNVFNYSHLLTVGFKSEDIFNEGGIIEATFYSYTPHGNLGTNLSTQ